MLDPLELKIKELERKPTQWKQIARGLERLALNHAVMPAKDMAKHLGMCRRSFDLFVSCTSLSPKRKGVRGGVSGLWLVAATTQKYNAWVQSVRPPCSEAVTIVLENYLEILRAGKVDEGTRQCFLGTLRAVLLGRVMDLGATAKWLNTTKDHVRGLVRRKVLDSHTLLMPGSRLGRIRISIINVIEYAQRHPTPIGGIND